jgi:hypothetical protein
MNFYLSFVVRELSITGNPIDLVQVRNVIAVQIFSV